MTQRVNPATLLANGTPDETVRAKRSYAGQFLRPVLARKQKG